MAIHLFPALAAAASSGLGLLRVSGPRVRLRDERPHDVGARDGLLDSSFGAARFDKTCERLREGRRAAEGLSFVALDGTTLIGTLRFWHVECGRVPALLLGPLAVAASHRSAGVGRVLMMHGLRRAARLGHGAVVLVGDAPYYARFGFTASPVENLVLPGPVDRARFLGLELRPGGLAGARGRVVATGLIVDRRGEERLRLAA